MPSTTTSSSKASSSTSSNTSSNTSGKKISPASSSSSGTTREKTASSRKGESTSTDFSTLIKTNPKLSAKPITNKDGDDITEYFDETNVLNAKIEHLVNLINQSKHIVLYTGAGISRAAGIRDYRSPNGVWTMKEKGVKTVAKKDESKIIFPTRTHMAISTLYNAGKIQYVTSQNVDGLHVKSGIPRKNMSELHGNTNVEICHKCNIEYVRNFRCRNNKNVHDHRTGRFCEKCKSELEDTIINFNENLPTDQLERAEENASKADLAIVVGTSMRVNPACSLPQMCKENGGKLVIINLQLTPKDKKADLRIFAEADKVIDTVMKKLALEIPPFILETEYSLESFESVNPTSEKKLIGFKITSPSPLGPMGSKVLRSISLKVHGSKVVSFKDTMMLDPIPSDCTKISAVLKYNLNSIDEKEAKCTIELENPLNITSKSFALKVNTSTNEITVTEK
ncbi:silent information regulator family protein [Naegleria gruberi]|uniref:protein acetyllysine N-acetyltransferase n=1 Tax=Naegleria gruberi TaxID=5762 RepID=D2VCI1_NAEGR|nr:silent information regulator family protein [Naegleria gruberi]EFC45314.1 silent information regulator family protein [Naegleria gruberi]|eukprot:XP_002678058.1 silent information regulator family protein [Naegleria gruberi strain NEG-M]